MIRTIAPSEPELVRLCRSKTWLSVSERMRSHPAEAMPTDLATRGEGSTALAAAVRFRAPLPVVQQLLHINFHQVGVTNVVRGSVLHEALKHRADDSVLEYLVQAAIAYDQKFPRHDSQCLLAHTDELGRTPLHYMVDRIVKSLDRGEEHNHTNWSIVWRLVEAHPDSVSTLDADGNTPLVLLLLIPKSTSKSGGLQLEEEVCRLVQWMVRHCPKAVTVSRRLPRPWHYQFPFETSTENSEGVPSPLSCALLHGRSRETIDLLLCAGRKLGVTGCKRFVTHYREIPLHIAVTMRRSDDVLKRLIEEDKKSVGFTDIHGLTALDWMWIRHTLDWCSSADPFAPVMVSRRRYINNHYPQWHERVSKQYLGLDKALEQSPNPMVRDMTKRLKGCMLKQMSTILPVMAAQYLEEDSNCMLQDDEDKEQFPLVHAACYVNCPLAMVHLACHSAPEQLRQKDSQLGRLPLHFASGRGGYSSQYPLGVSCNVQCMEEVSAVSMVLSLFPEASRVSDNGRRLPLHLAIDQAKEALQEDDDMFPSRCRARASYSNVETLLRGYPEALQRRDGVTKLFPFMQAAEGCDADLTLTFELLREDPTILSYFH